MPPETPSTIASPRGWPPVGSVTPRTASRRVSAAVSGGRPRSGPGRPGCRSGRRREGAVVYDSPVLPMRARTSRLKSLSVGMTQSSVGSRGRLPSSRARATGGHQATHDPGVCPPLPLHGPRWGGPPEVGRWITATGQLALAGVAGQGPRGACALGTDGQAGGGQALLDLGDGELAEVEDAGRQDGVGAGLGGGGEVVDLAGAAAGDDREVDGGGHG